MNFLQLAQRLRREMNDTGEGPSQVTNQQGRSLEYVEAIREAWLEIQFLRPWNSAFWKESYSLGTPQVFEVSTDTPFIPELHHLAIVFYAMRLKAISQNAQELVFRAETEWDKHLHLLCREFVDVPRFN